MTYCLGLNLRDGFVLMADTRTNAGVDNISTFSKQHVVEIPEDRVIVVMTAGNLGTSQSVMTLAMEGVRNPETGLTESLLTVPSMFEAARLMGRCVREVYRADGEALAARGIAWEASFLVAGQITGRRQRLFLVYSAGNFIEATPETPYMQIGEDKYGKPILDRMCRFDTPLHEAVKLSLISMDSTMRSNLSVGAPIDVLVYVRNEGRIRLRRRLNEQDAYFRMVREGWASALRQAYTALPDPPWVDLRANTLPSAIEGTE
jgi:putative proteasome-type protease